MTRLERITELSILLQQLKDEERTAEWVVANDAAVTTAPSKPSPFNGGTPRKPFACVVLRGGGQFVAYAEGNTEADARAHAFSTIFMGEALARGAS